MEINNAIRKKYSFGFKNFDKDVVAFSEINPLTNQPFLQSVHHTKNLLSIYLYPGLNHKGEQNIENIVIPNKFFSWYLDGKRKRVIINNKSESLKIEWDENGKMERHIKTKGTAIERFKIYEKEINSDSIEKIIPSQSGEIDYLKCRTNPKSQGNKDFTYFVRTMYFTDEKNADREISKIKNPDFFLSCSAIGRVNKYIHFETMLPWGFIIKHTEDSIKSVHEKDCYSPSYRWKGEESIKRMKKFVKENNRLDDISEVLSGAYNEVIFQGKPENEIVGFYIDHSNNNSFTHHNVSKKTLEEVNRKFLGCLWLIFLNTKMKCINLLYP